MEEHEGPSSDQTKAQDAPQEVVVTLVHGTWGRGFLPAIQRRTSKNNHWFSPGSTFCAEMNRAFSERGLKARISVFEWSGANSIKSREPSALRHLRMFKLRIKIPSRLIRPFLTFGFHSGRGCLLPILAH
jgi:hypothetical protein